MTPLQIVVLIVFLLILGGAAVYILLTGWKRMKNAPTRKEQFDERQKSARGFAYRAALGTLAGCEAITLLAWARCSASTLAFWCSSASPSGNTPSCA